MNYRNETSRLETNTLLFKQRTLDEFNMNYDAVVLFFLEGGALFCKK